MPYGNRAQPPGGAAFSTQYNDAGSFNGAGPGNAGEVLTSGGPGIPPSFQVAAGTPAAPAFSMQYNNAGAFGGTAELRFDPAGPEFGAPTMYLGAVGGAFWFLGNYGAGSGASLNFFGGPGDFGGVGDGGPISFTGGNGGATSGAGGDMTFNAGNASAGGGAPGALSLRAGNGPNVGNGGNVTLTSGNGGTTSGDGGTILIEAGPALGIGNRGTVHVVAATFDTSVTNITLITTNLGFYDIAAPIPKPTVTGSKGGNPALQSLLQALANLHLITDSTT